MSFVSDDFVLFYIIVAAAYFIVAPRWRWALVLAASYYFYAYWRLDYLFLFIFITLVNYAAGRAIGAAPPEAQGRRQVALWAAVAINLGTLFLFKYFNFFAGSVNAVLESASGPSFSITLDVLLPIGISFYTFQAMAYTIDVYRGDIPAEKHVGIFAAFIAYFPQLVAGPIERAKNLLPQFRAAHGFDYDRAVSGLRLILWGAFKKVVIADRLAAYVNEVYNHLPNYGGAHLILATVFFGIQIYCDFSGYSDIAIGCARLMGFDLMQNFRQPYFARSIREFWRRWHISLSTWFRDYLYFPLGGSRVALPRHLLNLFIVFFVSGLWHGANWTFVVWGGLHGLWIVGEELLDRANIAKKLRANAFFGTALTFTLVMIAWVFFRANTIQDAGYVLTHLVDFSRGFGGLTEPFESIAPLDSHRVEFLMALFTITVLIIGDGLAAFGPERLKGLAQQTLGVRVVRWSAYYAAVALILYSASTAQPNFIYFAF